MISWKDGTEFKNLTEKRKLFNALLNGDKDAIKKVMDELDRLEGIISEYEVGINILMSKFEEASKSKK